MPERRRAAARRSPVALACASLALAISVWPAPARAQTLVPLHVRSFSLGTDKTTVSVGEPFHLLVHVHVDEVLTQLDQTTLPSLYGFQSEGDERSCVGSLKGGTDCNESLELIASLPGERSIGPVTLDAIDASNGRASRFGTNVVTILVVPDPLAWVAPAVSSVFDFAGTVIRLLLLLIAVVLGILVLRWLFGRARRPASDMFVPPPAAAPVPPFVAAPPLDDFDTRYRAALDQLRASPTRASVIALRALVRERCGAGERETLGDLLARDAARGDAHLIAALRAIERCAFVEDANLGAAIVAAYPDLERLERARA